MPEFLATFDWISILFWIFLAWRMFAGFLKGGFKTLFTIIAIAVGIGAAFLLCTTVGSLFESIGVGQAISGSIEKAVGGSSDMMSTETSRAELNVYYMAWSTYNEGSFEDFVASYLHEGYSQCFLPSGLYPTLDKIITGAMPNEGTFTFASLIATALSKIACIGIGFAAVFLVVVIILLIIIGVVSRARAAKGKKPGILSRLLGMAFGFAIGAFSLWAISIGIKSTMTGFPDIWNVLSSSMHLGEEGYWNIGKFFFEIDFGYTDLLNWFLSFVHFEVA